MKREVRVCSIEGCQEAHAARGLCRKHYLLEWKRAHGLLQSGKPQVRLSVEQREIIVNMLRAMPVCADVARAYNGRFGSVSLRTVCTIKREEIWAGNLPPKSGKARKARQATGVGTGARGRPRQKRCVYAWPAAPNQFALFRYSREGEPHHLAATRVLNAARMVCYCRWYGWKGHVRSAPDGVIFWWEKVA